MSFYQTRERRRSRTTNALAANPKPEHETRQDDAGHHSSALFVQWVPYQLADGKTWEDEEPRYVDHLISICERFAPGVSDLVADSFTLTPPKIEVRARACAHCLLPVL